MKSRFCTKCGALIMPDEDICPRCGMDLRIRNPKGGSDTPGMFTFSSAGTNADPQQAARQSSHGKTPLSSSSGYYNSWNGQEGLGNQQFNNLDRSKADHPSSGGIFDVFPAVQDTSSGKSSGSQGRSTQKGKTLQETSTQGENSRQGKNTQNSSSSGGIFDVFPAAQEAFAGDVAKWKKQSGKKGNAPQRTGPQTGYGPQSTGPQTGYGPQSTAPQTGYGPQSTAPQTGYGSQSTAPQTGYGSQDAQSQTGYDSQNRSSKGGNNSQKSGVQDKSSPGGIFDVFPAADGNFPDSEVTPGNSPIKEGSEQQKNLSQNKETAEKISSQETAASHQSSTVQKEHVPEESVKASGADVTIDQEAWNEWMKNNIRESERSTPGKAEGKKSILSGLFGK